jgi:hypothetical protein
MEAAAWLRDIGYTPGLAATLRRLELTGRTPAFFGR